MTAKEFRKHLRSISSQGIVLSTRMNQTVAPLDLDSDDLGDLLGDASEGDFDFVSFDDEGAAFKKGFVPIGVVGHRDEVGAIEQPEGLLMVQMAKDKVVRYFTVTIGGTLVPGSETSYGADLAGLGLQPLA